MTLDVGGGPGRGSWDGSNSKAVKIPADPPRTTGLLYIRLNVTDVCRSKKWYVELLSLEVEQEDYGPDGDHVMLRDPRSRMYIALWNLPETTGHRFDKNRIGLNHLEFGVASRAELEAWEARLDALRIPHTRIEGHATADWVTFRDPDGILLEFCYAAEA